VGGDNLSSYPTSLFLDKSSTIVNENKNDKIYNYSFQNPRNY